MVEKTATSKFGLMGIVHCFCGLLFTRCRMVMMKQVQIRENNTPSFPPPAYSSQVRPLPREQLFLSKFGLSIVMGRVKKFNSMC
jgi:hypothetical protein